MSAPTSISFNVAGSPLSQNRAWHIITLKGKGGGHSSLALTTEGKQYKANVARIAALARPAGWDMSAEVIVELVYCFDSRRPDHDGPTKITIDALQGVLFDNDRAIWRSSQQRELDRLNPRAEITVRLRHPPQAQNSPPL